MPDVKGNNSTSEGAEVGPEENLTQQEAPEATGTAAPPTPSEEPAPSSGSESAGS